METGHPRAGIAGRSQPGPGPVHPVGQRCALVFHHLFLLGELIEANCINDISTAMKRTRLQLSGFRESSNTKHQARLLTRAPIWRLKFGASLVLGAWGLVLVSHATPPGPYHLL